MSNPVSRQELLAWLEHLAQSLLSDQEVSRIDHDELTQDLQALQLTSYAECKQGLTDKISKMMAYVRDDVPKLLSKKRPPFYGAGDGIGKNSSWIDLDDLVLMSVFLKTRCLCFNHYEPFDSKRPSRSSDPKLQWYQAVALGNGQAVLGNFSRKCFPREDIRGLLQDPKFCNLSGNQQMVTLYIIS